MAYFMYNESRSDAMTELETTPSTYRNLDADKIVESTTLLCRRIEERFPGRGLHKVCLDLNRVAREARQRAHWIARPHWAIRLLNGTIILVLVFLLVRILVWAHFNLNDILGLDTAGFLQTLEAAINDAILIGAALFFFGTLENRIKRSRALDALHELRSLAHVIDMHQLTKDPERALRRGKSTPSSPDEHFTLFELSRYLDYCSEMLSSIGKIAALYLQEFNDPVAMGAVNEIESLTTDLSCKIWQKIMIIHALEDAQKQSAVDLKEETAETEQAQPPRRGAD